MLLLGRGHAHAHPQREWRELAGRGDVLPARHCHSAVITKLHIDRSTQVNCGTNIVNKQQERDVEAVVVFGGYGRVNRQTIYFCDVHAAVLPNCDDIMMRKDNISVKWEYLRCHGNPPEVRHSHSAVLYGREMWIFGGISSGANALDDLAILDLDTMAWRVEAPRGTVTNNHINAAVVGNAGNLSSAPASTSAVAVARIPDTTVFTVTGERPEPRWGHSAVVCDFDGEPSMLVFGGYGSTFLADMHQFIFRTREWRRVRTFGTAIRGRQFHAAAVIRRTMYIIGGFAVNANLSDCFQFNLDTHTLTRVSVPDHVADRRGHTLTAVELGPLHGSKGLAAADRRSTSKSSDGTGFAGGIFDSGEREWGLLVCGGKRSFVEEEFSTFLCKPDSGRSLGGAPNSTTTVDADVTSVESEEPLQRPALSALEWKTLDHNLVAGKPPSSRHFHACVPWRQNILVLGGFEKTNKNDVFLLSFSKGDSRSESTHGLTAQHSSGLERMVGARMFSDVLLQASDGVSIPAHKVVLGAFSERFAAAISSAMRGGGTPSATEVMVVDVGDVSQTVLLAMLTWIYSGGKHTSLSSSDDLVDLYRAADAYLLHDLRDECESWLCRGVTRQNASDLDALATQLSGSRLQAACARFLSEH